MRRVILTDIEGTTSPIAFVREVLFPYARRELPGFVRSQRGNPQVRSCLDQVRAETDQPGASDEDIVALLQRWIDEDRKRTALKTLQGMIWEAGYRDGDFQAPVYPDAVRQMQAWKQQGLRLAVYSSGSVQAQQLFFAHSDHGDLSGLFSAWFDTTSGAKRETEAYRTILAALECSDQPSSVLFLSDIVAELDAARNAGLDTVWVARDGQNSENAGHPVVASFDDVQAA